MIGFLRGTLRECSATHILLDTAGVGYEVAVTTVTARGFAERLGEEVSVHTHLAVRDDAFELYGFENARERSFFRLLLTVPGIGPKSALSILSIADMETLSRAIASKNAGYLTGVSGIGKKTAEKIVVELHEKAGLFGAAMSEEILAEEADALEALKTLGYSPSESREALKKIPSDIKGSNQRIKEALRILGKA